MEALVIISREQLYQRVWSAPVTKLSKEFGLSGVGFAKLCKRNEIPLPPRGYWAKKAAGQTQPIPGLPRPNDDREIEIIAHEKHIENLGLRAEVHKTLAHVVPAEPIVVPETLRGAHTLVAQSLHLLDCAETDKNGLIKTPMTGCVDVRVSKDTLRRALRIMDAVIKTFEARGYAVHVLSDKKGRYTVVDIMENQVSFGLRELLAEKKILSGNTTDLNGKAVFRHNRFERLMIPSGVLCLEIEPRRDYDFSGDGRQRKWTGGKRGNIEDCLNQFIAGVIDVATGLREVKLEAERQESKRKEEERLYAEREAVRIAMYSRIEQEKANVAKLKDYARDWTESQKLRAYIDAVRQSAIAQGKNIDKDCSLGQWLIWAECQANRLDPLKESPASIIDEEDKYREPEIKRFW